jgi:dTDP-glucose 4,6-dehydratase
VANIDLSTMLCALMDELASRHEARLPVGPSRELITDVSDRPGHDRCYTIDASKIEAKLGWTLQVSVQKGLRRTVEWYLSNQGWGQPLLK